MVEQYSSYALIFRTMRKKTLVTCYYYSTPLPIRWIRRQVFLNDLKPMTDLVLFSVGIQIVHTYGLSVKIVFIFEEDG